MNKVDQLRALREAAATAAPKPMSPERIAAMAAVAPGYLSPPNVLSAFPASTTYQYRDPDKRRAYMREYAKKRRALKAAEREAAKERAV
jgi:hypothetical protein